MPSALDVAGISAVVSAFVSTFANALLRWGGRALNWLRRVTQADHAAIGGVPTINNVLPDRVGVYVAFGPPGAVAATRSISTRQSTLSRPTSALGSRTSRNTLRRATAFASS